MILFRTGWKALWLSTTTGGVYLDSTEVSDDAVINWIREITGFREEYNEQTKTWELKSVKDRRKKLEILKVSSRGFYGIY